MGAAALVFGARGGMPFPLPTCQRARVSDQKRSFFTRGLIPDPSRHN